MNLWSAKCLYFFALILAVFSQPAIAGNSVPSAEHRRASGPLAVACADNEAEQFIYVADTGNARVVKLQIQNSAPGSSPEHIIESFKAALLAEDVDKTATFFIKPIVEDYKAIFEDLSDDLQDIADDMGEMSLYMSDDGMAIYEISNSTDTKLHPIIFSIDENGNWKISKF